MKPLHVAVLMGGSSAEKDVSLQSGEMVARALRNAGLRVTEVVVPGPEFVLPADVDVAFLALHGTFGEDGQVQQILEDRGVPYTGSGVAASAKAFDKNAAKEEFIAAKVPTPAYTRVNGDLRVLDGLGLPVVIKPARQGASLGVTIVQRRANLAAAVAKAREFEGEVLAEKYIRGRELTVGVLDGQALPVVEIRTKRKFFDRKAKYVPGEAEEIVPAPLEAMVAARAQTLALRAHECLGCRDVSRTDLMLSADGELFVLEVNTLPGMTANSLLPKAARAAGLSMEEVCVRLVNLALARRRAAATA